MFSFLKNFFFNFYTFNFVGTPNEPFNPELYDLQLREEERKKRNQRIRIIALIILIFLLAWCEGNPVNSYVSATPVGKVIENTKQVGRNIAEELGVEVNNPGRNQDNPGQNQDNPGQNQDNPGQQAIPQDDPVETPPPSDGCIPPEWINPTLSFSDITKTSFVVSWGEAGDDVAVTQWKIVFNDDVLTFVDGSVSSYRITNLQPGTQYKVKIEPGDVDNCFAANNPEDFVTTLNDDNNNTPPGTDDEDDDDDEPGVAVRLTCNQDFNGLDREDVQNSFLRNSNGSLELSVNGMKRTPDNTYGIVYIFEQNDPDEIYGAIVYSQLLTIQYISSNFEFGQSGGENDYWGVVLYTNSYRDGTELEKGRDYTFNFYTAYSLNTDINYILENVYNPNALDLCYNDKHSVGPANIPSSATFIPLIPYTPPLIFLPPLDSGDDEGSPNDYDECQNPLPTEVQPELVEVSFQGRVLNEGDTINVPYFSPSQYENARSWAVANPLILTIEDDCQQSGTGFYGEMAITHPSGVGSNGLTYYDTLVKFYERGCSDPGINFDCPDSSEMNYGENTLWVGIKDISSNNEWEGGWAYLSNKVAESQIYTQPQTRVYHVFLSNLSCISSRSDYLCQNDPPTVTDSRFETPVRIRLYDRDGNGSFYGEYLNIQWVNP